MPGAVLCNILYVEDDLDIQEVTKMSLEMLGGYTLKACSSGAEAIKAAKTFEADLILLDVMMPDMDGPTTLTALREFPKMQNIPAVFMTAKIMPEDIDRYKAMGAVDIISKPFDPMGLASRIREIWENRHDG